MSFFNYMFDSEWSQRSDIEGLKDRDRRMRSRVSSQNRSNRKQNSKIEGLEQDIAELALLNKALMSIILEKGVCTGQELEQVMKGIDLEDGPEDGAWREQQQEQSQGGQECASCGRLVHKKRRNCLYCGQFK